MITGRLKNVLKMSLKSYNSLKDVFSMLWMSQRRLLYVMDVLKTSFVRYECLKDVFCTLWMSQRRLLYVMDVSKTSFVRYECLKDIFCALWMSQRRLLYVMDVSKTSFVCCWCLEDVFCTLWMSQRRPRDGLYSLGTWVLYAEVTIKEYEMEHKKHNFCLTCCPLEIGRVTMFFCMMWN